MPTPNQNLGENEFKKTPQICYFFSKTTHIQITAIMKTKHIIERLNAHDTMEHNNALRYINSTMKAGVLTKVKAPIFMDKEEIWNQALIAFWQNIAVRRLIFDYSKEDAIQRFLYTVCKRQVFRGVKQYNRHKAESLDNVQTMITDTNIENSMIEMELLRNIQHLLRKCINETEWQVLIHRFWDMMSYDEMSAAMLKTSDCLKTTKHRAINKIKKALHEDSVLQTYLRFLLNESSTIH